MKTSVVKVEKVVLNLNGNTVELTVEEATTLQRELDALLGNKQPIINMPNSQFPVFVRPLYVHEISPPSWPFTGPTCGLAGHSGSQMQGLGANTCSQITN